MIILSTLVLLIIFYIVIIIRESNIKTSLEKSIGILRSLDYKPNYNSIHNLEYCRLGIKLYYERGEWVAIIDDEEKRLKTRELNKSLIIKLEKYNNMPIKKRVNKITYIIRDNGSVKDTIYLNEIVEVKNVIFNRNNDKIVSVTIETKKGHIYNINPSSLSELK